MSPPVVYFYIVYFGIINESDYNSYYRSRVTGVNSMNYCEENENNIFLQKIKDFQSG